MLFLFPVIAVVQNIDLRQRAYFHCGGQGGANCLSPIYSDGWLQDQRIGMICVVPANNYPLDIFKIDIISDWIQNSFDLSSCHLRRGI